MSLPPRVLVVEDHPELAELLQEVVELQGIPVNIANDVTEALRLYRALRPRMTLIDLRLGEGSGIDLARAITREPPPHGLLVAMTGMRGDALEQEARAAGFERVLLKPFDISVLSALVDEVLARV